MELAPWARPRGISGQNSKRGSLRSLKGDDDADDAGWVKRMSSVSYTTDLGDVGEASEGTLARYRRQQGSQEPLLWQRGGSLGDAGSRVPLPTHLPPGLPSEASLPLSLSGVDRTLSDPLAFSGPGASASSWSAGLPASPYGGGGSWAQGPPPPHMYYPGYSGCPPVPMSPFGNWPPGYSAGAFPPVPPSPSYGGGLSLGGSAAGTAPSASSGASAGQGRSPPLVVSFWQDHSDDEEYA
eukprot:SRR837773.21830.p1 GENE.SRR837773.21830~~SRR837773.21830.p1  ORF type:complete len:247 (-),score=5.63 SRR837773.21830:60-776(-)